MAHRDPLKAHPSGARLDVHLAVDLIASSAKRRAGFDSEIRREAQGAGNQASSTWR